QSDLIGMCEAGDSGLQCFSDDFQSQPLDEQWRVFSSSGNFTPSITNNRMRLTQAVQNQATASTFQRIFPAAGNRVEVEFDYFAYGGNGADGVAIVFSDASVTPQVGAFGGPLGFGYKVNEQKPGFAGGWLGIGLDEYGNYSIEGGGNGPGRRQQAVVLRGSGSGYSGYNYLAGTCNNGTT
ncbi:MSHA biogenesis protein MshQ, partial [Vibrio anguillarum]|nr:MSHA biogenesis protein MshQ [Vibrio anguillarum]